MFDITIVAMGKIKTHHWLAAQEEYRQRLRPYAKLNLVELASESFSVGGEKRAKEIEARRLQDFLEKNSKKNNQPAVYLLAERGRNFTSLELATWLDKNSSLILVIGGALGFSPELYKSYPQISLSALTFPHELARVILLEQLYRATTISRHKTYHY